MENYCAWCFRHRDLTYPPGGRPVLCTPCVEAWMSAQPAARPLPDVPDSRTVPRRRHDFSLHGEIVFDGCCGEGGAARGYAESGAYVVGCDINPACRDGYLRSGAHEFICADVLEVLADKSFMSRFTFIHYSPPCQFASGMLNCQPPEVRARYPNLITPGRPLLNDLSLPYVIENVGAARPWLQDPVTLCMWMSGRETYRHRLFEAGGGLTLQPPPARPQPGTCRTATCPHAGSGSTGNAAGLTRSPRLRPGTGGRACSCRWRGTSARPRYAA